MAAASFSLVAEDDLSCPVCFNLLKDPNTPKELDCSHICCAPCIQQMIEGGRRVVDCPECRQVTRIPKDGVDKMKTAYRLRSLAEKYHEHTEKKAQDLTNANDSFEELKYKDLLCQDHNLVVDLFCKKCNAFGCSSCMWHSHKGAEHDVSEMTTVYRKQQEQMAAALNQMDAEIEKYEQSLKGLSDLKKKMKQVSVQQKEDLVKRSELLIAAVEKHVQQLQEDYDCIEQPKIGRIHSEQIRLQKQVSEMREIKSSVQSTMDTCGIREYVEQHDALSRSVNSELEKDYQVPKDLDPVIGKARLEIQKSYNCKLRVGTLLQVKTCKLIQIQEFALWTTSWLPTSVSVATAADGLLVVRFDNHMLKTYRLNKDGIYKKESDVKLADKNKEGRPWGLAVSVSGEYLVVRGTVVEIYSPSGQYKGILEFKPTPDGKGKGICRSMKPRRLQVDTDDGLLVADDNHGIIQFTPDGMFQQCVATTFVLLAIAVIRNGKIAATNWQENKLSIIDMKSGTENLTVEIPNAQAVCYHEASDTLLVGRTLGKIDQDTPDISTGVIEQYCPTSGALVSEVYRWTSEDLNPRDMIVTIDEVLIVVGAVKVKTFSIGILE